MTTFAALVRTAPYGALAAAEAVRHLGALDVLGFARADGLFCDDGVWALVAGQRPAPGMTSLEAPLVALASAGVALLADRASLAERGLAAADLLRGAEIVDSLDDRLAAADVVVVF